MESDIVEQLREEGFVTHMARLPRESKILHAAADEIERLRKERDLAGDNLDELRGRNRYPAMSERFRLSEELDNARYENNLLVQKCRELQERIDALKHEVDAKEKINSTLTSSFDALRRERDEARWEVCGFHHLTGFLAGDYAISRGWNYFNDERKWAKFPPSVKDFDLYLKGQEQFCWERVDSLKKRIEDIKNGLEGCCTACEPVALMNKRLLEERTNDKRA